MNLKQGFWLDDAILSPRVFDRLESVCVKMWTSITFLVTDKHKNSQ